MTALSSRIGRHLEAQGKELRFFLGALGLLVFADPRAWRFRMPLIVEHLGRSGILTIPIATLVAMLIGMILVMQTAPLLANFGQINMTASLVGVSITRELGPLMTAIIVTGRVGAAYTAEIGTMKVNEEILAAETMAVDPVDLLVVPRLIALSIALPCLTIFADFAAILAAMFVGSLFYDIPYETFLSTAQIWVKGEDLVHGTIKSILFGLVIAHICCYEAFQLRGGAQGVGRATMQAVVRCIVLVLIVDAAYTALTR